MRMVDDDRFDRKAPIFVLGCGRSGSTLLRLMLTSHPNIGIPPEGTFMLGLFGKYYRGGAVLRESIEHFCEMVFRSDRFSEWNLDRSRVLARLAAVQEETYANLIDAVYSEYVACLDSTKQRWGDKNIDYVMSIPKILTLFPNAKIIHVIRDGRDVALSYRAVDFGPNGLFSTAVFWRRRTLTGRASGEWAGPARYFEIKYEDLVEQPEHECQRLCDFLGEEFSPQMLRFYEYNQLKELIPKHRLAWHQRTLEPVTQARVRLWKQQMSQRELMIFESVAGTALERFGYETHDFPVPANLRVALLGEWAKWFGRGLWRRVGDAYRVRMP